LPESLREIEAKYQMSCTAENSFHDIVEHYTSRVSLNDFLASRSLGVQALAEIPETSNDSISEKKRGNIAALIKVFPF
jgi:hypothetical protein